MNIQALKNVQCEDVYFKKFGKRLQSGTAGIRDKATVLEYVIIFIIFLIFKTTKKKKIKF